MGFTLPPHYQTSEDRRATKARHVLKVAIVVTAIVFGVLVSVYTFIQYNRAHPALYQDYCCQTERYWGECTRRGTGFGSNGHATFFSYQVPCVKRRCMAPRSAKLVSVDPLVYEPHVCPPQRPERPLEGIPPPLEED
jgi:hypothetical protein